MTQPKRIIVDFFQINEIAAKGIRRAAVFMGLGVNAAGNTQLSEYRLTSDTNLRLLPDTVSPEVLAEWKSEFRLWAVSCGFRELVDQLCVYVDQIHQACDLANGTYTMARAEEFERWGLDIKLLQLQRRFGFTLIDAERLGSFYPVRNCFGHRLGRVGHKDVKDKGVLALIYRRVALVSSSVDGRVIRWPDLMDPKTPPFQIPAGFEQVGFQFAEETITFREGEIIRLTPKQLTELLFFSDFCLKQINKAAIDFAKAKGVLSEGEPPTNADDLSAPKAEPEHPPTTDA